MNNNIVDISDHHCEVKEQLLERLFHEHVGALRGFLRMRMGVQGELDDIVQDVFARLARVDNLSQKVPTEGSSRSYLFAVANNLVVDMERKKARQRRFAETQRTRMREEDEQTGDSPESLMLAMGQVDVLKQTILDMKPLWRDAFILIRLKSMTYKEAAAEMGVGSRQAERYLNSALKQIRRVALGNVSGEGR